MNEEEKKQQTRKSIDISPELEGLLKEMREGYKEALGLDISWRQASYILAMKIKKARLEFKFP